MTKVLGVLAVVAVGGVLGVGAFCPDDCCPLSGGGSANAAALAAQEAKPGCCASKAQTTSTTDEKKPGCCATAKLTGTAQEGKSGCGATQTAGTGCGAKAAGQEGKAGCGSTQLTAAQSEGQCPKSAMCKTALASMPKMMYRVGDQELCCPMGAETASKESGKPVRFVVAGEVFDTKELATVKLVSVTETYANDLLSMQFSAGGECFRCPVSAEEAAKKAQTAVKYRAAGVDFDCKEKAAAALAAAQKAVAGVKLVAYVGDKEYACCVEAGKAAKESGKELVYVVGEQKTPCETTAKLNFAQAKVQAIVNAAVDTAFASAEMAAPAKVGSGT